MPSPRCGRAAADQHESWLVLGAETHESGHNLAASPLAVPAFFAGWLLVGVLVAWWLVRRGHDTRTMLALGACLGPLMGLVASDTVRRRERIARPLMLASPVDHGGPLDVLVLVQGRPDEVRSVGPTLEAVAPDLGTVMVARAVAYEWLEGDIDNDVVRTSEDDLVAAVGLLPVMGAGVALWPGPVDRVTARAGDGPAYTLVLNAIDESASGSRWDR